MSKVTEELKEHLKIFNLTNDETKLIDEILGFAEERNEIKNTKAIDNFQPDTALKEIFTKISKKLVIDFINEYTQANFNTDREIKFIFNEYFGSIGNTIQRYTRGDLAVLVEGGEEDELNNTIVLELQSSHKKNIPFRVNAYGSNHLKPVKMKVKSLVDDKIVMVEKEVFVRPFELVLYTSVDVKEKQGVLDFNTTSAHYMVNGSDQYAKDGDVITNMIPFVNILQYSLEELNNSSLGFLQAVYLYKYKQDKSLLKGAKISEISKIIEDNLKKMLSPEDFDLVMKHHVNLFDDLFNIMVQNKKEYKEELESMEFMRETFYDRAKREGREEGREKERSNTILNMLKCKVTEDDIHQMTGYPLSQIKKVKSQHTI